MSHVIIYNTSTRAVLAIDPQIDPVTGPVLPVGIPSAAVTISDTEAAKIQDGNDAYTLDLDDATILVTAVPTPDPVVADAVTERNTSITDLTTNYADGNSRLADIITNGSAYSTSDVRTAMIDLATILKRVHRALDQTAPRH